MSLAVCRSIGVQGKVCVHGDGQTLRDYVFAPDLPRGRTSDHAQGQRHFQSRNRRECALLQILETIRESLGSISRWFAFRPMPIGTLTCVTTPRDCRRHLENSSLRR